MRARMTAAGTVSASRSRSTAELAKEWVIASVKSFSRVSKW